MDNVLTHKGYFSIVKYSPESEILYGRIEAIVDLVSYEGETAKEVKAAFEEAVESYLETCVEVGKKPDKPYTGTFNVRVNTDLHRKAAILSKQRNISLNQLIGEALARYVGG
ncbi:type II toxin-antitoxin system HicB family antitoxin [Hymenobacter antarcticus]|uniref:Type II toxin-antitoxin system HicB family antitoxin n=1 Tax=Hymenobacter antarcticus TaxID=486270 RepID=A0ABP7Q2H8_9BACT